MIIDFRKEYESITRDEIKRWNDVGAKTILFTLHHPYQFKDENLEKLIKKTDIIHEEGLRAGIYTGLLGIEKYSTIKAYDLYDFLQRTKEGKIVHYHPHKKKPWGPMFCPNSEYISFKKRFLKKAIKALDLDNIFFDLPWYRAGGGHCDSCKDGFEKFLSTKGFRLDRKTIQNEIKDRYSPLYSEFLRFKVKSIHSSIRSVSQELKEEFPGLRTLFNMGSTLSNIDNQHDSSWLTNLHELDSDVMIEFNPFAPYVKTPLEAVTASINLARTSLKGKGDVVFASTISDRPSTKTSKFYTPKKLLELYSRIKEAGGIPYLSYATSNPNLKHKLSAPVERYFEMYKKVNLIPSKQKEPKVAVVYSRMSYHYSMRDPVRFDDMAYCSQSQYLPFIWNTLRYLEKFQIDYDLIDIKSDEINRYDTIILPRTVIIGDDQIAKIRDYAQSGKNVIATHLSGALNKRGELRARNPLKDISEVEYIEKNPDWNSIIRTL